MGACALIRAREPPRVGLRMLYEIMLIGIGFLSACLGMAMLAPAIHARAVRLTVRRVLAGLPRSIVEARAHKDQLRAEFAVTIRRLEMTIADMQAKTAGGSGEVARKAAEIERLTRELRKAQVAVLRFQAHELMRRSITRTIVKLLVYLYERSQRSLRRPGQAREAGAEPGHIRRVLSMGRGVWVPAFAGTTAEDVGRPPSGSSPALSSS
jgi:hypothetical protein